MVDILRVGSNSLLSLQQALNTTGHNIANVNTAGYSRQSVEFGTNVPQLMGFGYVGQGASISTIERAYDQFLTTQVQNFSASRAQYEVLSAYSAHVDELLASSESNLGTAMQDFFNALHGVANNPASLPERQVLLGQSEKLIHRSNSFANMLSDLNQELNRSLQLTVRDINSGAADIARLNGEIVSAIANGGNSPNDLLDRRDLLVRELAEKVSLSTVQQDDGSLNIFIGNGQPMVLGSQSYRLKTQFNAYDGSKLEIGMEGQNNVNGLSQIVKGGELQGLLDFRNRTLDPLRSRLGLLMLGFSESMNAQHRSGLTLENELGSDFFSTAPAEVRAHAANAGSAQPVLMLQDVSMLQPSDYQLSHDGSQWHLRRMRDGVSVSGSGPLSLDGMTLDLSSGTAIAGDSFLISPARDALGEFALLVKNPRQIAAAAALYPQSGISNAGSAGLDNLELANSHSLPLSGPVILDFDPDALGTGVPGFVVSGGLSMTLAYDPATEAGGKTLVLTGSGISFTASGVPEPGDSFSIDLNLNAPGDNRNMLAMVGLQSTPILEGGQSRLQDYFGETLAQVGVSTRQARSSFELERTLLEQAEAEKNALSGVNLDEEATRLLRYQQSYQASAQLVKVADELFQVLMNSF